MSIKTDSKTVEDPKDPETCPVFTLYRLFASQQEQDALAARYRAGGMGYGEAKQALYEKADAYFAPARARRADLASRPNDVRDILRQGASRARAKIQQVLARAQAACGVGPIR
jgi:tryptophanyl-tRNA synthetase